MAVATGSDAHARLTADERFACCRSLINVLLADQEPLAEGVWRWAEREMVERKATPSELLSVAADFSEAVRNLTDAEGAGQVDERLGAMDIALARYFANLAERLTVEKSQVEALYGIAQELTTSMDLSRMLHRTLTGVVAATSGEMGAVFLMDSAVGQVTTKTAINWNKGCDVMVPLSEVPDEWQLGRVDTVLVLNDLSVEETESWVASLIAPDMGSLMVAPLIANGAFMGFLAVAASLPGAFGPAQLQLFHSILGPIAAVISNAEVYSLITRQAQELGQMLRHQQEEGTKSHSILTSIADGVVVNNAEGEMIMINPAAERILEMDGEELVGRDFRVLFSTFDKGKDEAVAAMDTLLNTPPAEVRQAFKMVLKVEIGKLIINAQLSPVQTQRDDFLGVVTVLRDISKEVEADRTKSEFVSNVSHELRTPMTAIKGYTDLLFARAVGPINDDQEKFLGTIRSNADRLTALINDLLDISRVETGRVRFEPRPLQIGDVIADVVNSLAVPADNKHQILTYEVVAGMSDVVGDRDRLTQVLTNLVGNAIHYTPDGGKIEVRAYPIEGAVRVDVRDTGIGVAPKDMPHIFERFYRADNPMVQESQGTGLGLSIVKMFVEMHGGRVWVESESGQGSTFTFILPAAEHAIAPAAQVSLRTSRLLMSRARTVLVVDDSPDVSELVRINLERSGYKVFVLARGKAVKAWVEKKRPDLILLDLILPDMVDTDGLDVLRDLKSNPTTADVPVVILSIAQDDGTAWQLGAVDYLTKPVDHDVLLQSVEQALTWQGLVLIVEDDPDTIGLFSSTMRKIGFTPLVASNGV